MKSIFSIPLVFWFLMGCALAQEKAKWITNSFSENTEKRATLVFKKDFKILKAVRSAKLMITALGLYEAELNGKRVGQDYFTPGFTAYHKRLQYQEYDVTAMLKDANEIQVTVAEGWYRGIFRKGRADTAKNNYGSQAGLYARLMITYQNGSVQDMVTDGSWRCGEGPIRYAQLYDGEMYDAGYVVKNWQTVKILDYPTDLFVPSEAEPVRKKEVLKPDRIFIAPNGEQVVDFGQNIAGHVRLKVRGHKGDTVRISHAEVLDPEGNFYTGNLRTAKAQDIYILNGEGTELLEPHFTYHGFRYAKIEGMKAARDNCTAVALYSDLKQTGTFSCSDPLINRLQKNIEWSMKSNFFDIPTDCPQRSERLGWTGDAQVFAATASFLMDIRRFYSKWLKDLSADQGSNGAVPTFLPTSAPAVEETRGVAGWGDAATIIPWVVYQTFGDTTVLTNQYQSMKRWVDYISSVSPDGLWKEGGYGDWYAMGEQTSIAFIDQCFYAHSADLLAQTATVLGYSADALKYRKLHVQIKASFMDAYGKLDTQASSTQTAYLLALVFDLLPEAQRPGVAAQLAEKIRSNGNKLATGFLGTPYLLPILSRFGYTDLAYTLLMQKECPSWLYPLTQGATTIWERWDSVRPDGSLQQVSFNHYSYGAVGQWLYQHVIGISPAAPGYRKIIIKPEIGGGLRWAKGSYTCDYGKISSSWRLSGRKVILEVEVPKGTSAEIYVPGEQLSRNVNAGRYTFVGHI